MTARRKRTTTGTKQPPNNISPYYSYPQYGYGSPPYYNPVYTYPANSYNNTEYSYYPLNDYGQIIGPPTSYPPVSSRYYQDYYPYTDYNIPPHGSYMPSPRRDRTLYDDYYYYPHSDRRYEKPRRETLPPIQKHPLSSARLVSPNDNEYQQFVVRNLTERDSASSELSNRNAIRRNQQDKLRKSYR